MQVRLEIKCCTFLQQIACAMIKHSATKIIEEFDFRLYKNYYAGDVLHLREVCLFLHH